MRFRQKGFSPILLSALMLIIFPRALTAQTDVLRNLSVVDARPVAKAVETVMSRYPEYAITYEDPKFQNSDDITDVTETVRRDLSDFAPNQAPRVYVPRGGEIRVDYLETEGRPNDVVDLAERIVDEHNRLLIGGQFAINRTQDWIHVIPVSVRNTSGVWSGQSSILDVIISIPAENDTAFAIIKGIVNQISIASGEKVVVGTVPLSLLMNARVNPQIQLVTARNALMDTLAATGARVTWFIYYDINMDGYVLNLLLLSPPSRPQRVPREPERGTAPSAFGPEASQ